MSEDRPGPPVTILELAPRRGGRPRVILPREALSTRVTAPEYDQIVERARARGVSVSAFVRAAVVGAIRRGE